MQPGRPFPPSHPSRQPVVHLGATQCYSAEIYWWFAGCLQSTFSLNIGMLLFEPRAGFGCDCLHVAAASPSPKCHGDPCQTGSLAESSNTFPFLVLVLLILDTASCFKPLGVITSLQSSILYGKEFPGYPNTSRPPHFWQKPKRNGAFRMCRLSALLLCVLPSLIHPDLRDTS